MQAPTHTREHHNARIPMRNDTAALIWVLLFVASMIHSIACGVAAIFCLFAGDASGGAACVGMQLVCGLLALGSYARAKHYERACQ